MKGQRWQIFLAGFLLWGFLAFWSVSVFWAHIDGFAGSDFKRGMYVGAAAGELVLLILLFWHCFNVHIGVRRVCIFLGLILTFVVVVHSAALRGKSDALQEQTGIATQAREQLTQMGNEQAAAQIASLEAERDRPGTTARRKRQIGAEIKAIWDSNNKQAQGQLSEIITGSTARVDESSILPPWYLHGWCYAVIFCIAALFIFIPSLMMLNKDDIDANFDGIPDRQQQGTATAPARAGGIGFAPATAAAPAASSGAASPKP